MTTMVRDEADIIDQQIAFHLAAGVDFVVATDHQSVDGTTEVLERYARQGVLHLLRGTGATKRQSERFTRMARMAAVEFGADWIINSDADEFWWPWGGDLKDVLAEVPERFGIVHTFVRPFLARPGDGPFAERMTVRLTPAAPINSPSGPFRPNVRLLHRAADDVIVGNGNASIRASALRPLRGWSPVEVLHFPIRSFGQFERKFLRHYQTSDRLRRGDHVRTYEAAQAGGLHDLYNEICVDDGRLRRGLDEGSLAIDYRMRDALRALAADPAALRFPRRTALDEVGYAVDGNALEAGELVRRLRRVDQLRQRVARLETPTSPVVVR
jgi:Glycosyl transferase family 2